MTKLQNMLCSATYASSIVAFESIDGTVNIVDVNKWTLVAIYKTRTKTGDALAPRPTGTIFAHSRFKGLVQIVNWADGKIIAARDFRQDVGELFWVQDSHVLINGYRKKLILWDWQLDTTTTIPGYQVWSDGKANTFLVAGTRRSGSSRDLMLMAIDGDRVTSMKMGEVESLLYGGYVDNRVVVAEQANGKVVVLGKHGRIECDTGAVNEERVFAMCVDDQEKIFVWLEDGNDEHRCIAQIDSRSGCFEKRYYCRSRCNAKACAGGRAIVRSDGYFDVLRREWVDGPPAGLIAR